MRASDRVVAPGGALGAVDGAHHGGGSLTPTKRNSESSVPAVSKSTVPTLRIRSKNDWSVLTFCTRSTRVSWVFLERIPRRICSRSVVMT